MHDYITLIILLLLDDTSIINQCISSVCNHLERRTRLIQHKMARVSRMSRVGVKVSRVELRIGLVL